MEERAVRGIPWTILAFASSRAISLLTAFVLARLLTPSDFGVWRLASSSDSS